MKFIQEVKQKLLERFKIKDIGEYKFFLGVGIERDWEKGKIRLTQTVYLKAIIERFGLIYRNPTTTLYVSKER